MGVPSRVIDIGRLANLYSEQIPPSLKSCAGSVFLGVSATQMRTYHRFIKLIDEEEFFQALPDPYYSKGESLIEYFRMAIFDRITMEFGPTPTQFRPNQ
jgi:hypothetical protein